MLYHLAQRQDQRKTASALEPCAQLEFQSMVGPCLRMSVQEVNGQGTITREPVGLIEQDVGPRRIASGYCGRLQGSRTASLLCVILCMKPEHMSGGCSLVGVEPAQVATVVAVVPLGDAAATLIYNTPDGTLKDRLLNRADEAGINPATTERPLSFDGDAEAINLTAPPNPLRASVLGRRRSRLLRIYHQLERHRIRCRCRARTSRPATSRL